MLNMFIHSPHLQAWHSRLARMPRWGWIVIGVPIVVIGGAVLLFALLVGLALFAAVGAIRFFTSSVRRMFARPVDDGRRNVRIMVHSARVLDP